MKHQTVLLVLLLVACGGTSPTEPSHREEGTGSEPGESGQQYAKDDEAHETRRGVELVMRYVDDAFVGTVTNTTAAPVADVRVEIHLSNGVELGPTPRRTLAAGETADVRLDASDQVFTTWSVHVEIGSGSGS